MDAVIFIGIQASGKSTFFKQRFNDTHIRINMDMLRTRHRERLLYQACLDAKQPVVIDNTNPTAEDRARYINVAKEHDFTVCGYYFQSQLEACKQRNQAREDKVAIPLPGLLSTHRKLELPELNEGFDQLYYVQITESGDFHVEEWDDEV